MSQVLLPCPCAAVARLPFFRSLATAVFKIARFMPLILSLLIFFSKIHQKTNINCRNHLYPNRDRSNDKKTILITGLVHKCQIHSRINSKCKFCVAVTTVFVMAETHNTVITASQDKFVLQ